MNVRNLLLLVDLNKEFCGYKNDIFLTKFFKRTGSTCKVNTKSAPIFPRTYRSRSIIVQWFGNIYAMYVREARDT